MEFVSTFETLVREVSFVMTRPTFQSFLIVLAGWIFARRRTVTGMIQAAGAVGTKHHSAFHRVFAAARWSLDELGLAALDLVLRLLDPAAGVWLAVDDTLARKRGLPTPLTVTSDGAPGCLAAIEATWPSAERIRCWVHKMKNVLEKVPEAQREEIKRLLVDVREAPNHELGRERAQALVEELRSRDLPSAAGCLEDDLAASLAHLKLPGRHPRTVRTTNLCERSFVEERRRAKVLPRFRGEKECLKLVFATLWRASERWRGVKFTTLEREELNRYIQARRADGFEVRNLVPAA